MNRRVFRNTVCKLRIDNRICCRKHRAEHNILNIVSIDNYDTLRNLGARARCCGNRNQRNRGIYRLLYFFSASREIIMNTALVCGKNCGTLRYIHRASAACNDNKVAFFRLAKSSALINRCNPRIRLHLCKRDG